MLYAHPTDQYAESRGVLPAAAQNLPKVTDLIVDGAVVSDVFPDDGSDGLSERVDARNYCVGHLQWGFQSQAGGKRRQYGR